MLLSLQQIFRFTLIPLCTYTYQLVGICLLYFVSLGSLGFYPNYYVNQKEIWSFDLCVGFIIYLLLIYYHKTSNLFLEPESILPQNQMFYENIECSSISANISLGFYLSYVLYWLYYAIFMFLAHPEFDAQIQIYNCLMGFSWYLFFSEISMLYYYICVKLATRHDQVVGFLKKMKKSKPTVQEFCSEYLIQYKKTKLFARQWNTITYFGLVLLTFHVPIDLASILVSKKYYDIPGFIIKSLSLIWYVYLICKLNNLDNTFGLYLTKHQVFGQDDIQTINLYTEARPLGLVFYGIKLNENFFMQMMIIIINFIIPIMYALFANNLI